jgi:hypothetical protein
VDVRLRNVKQEIHQMIIEKPGHNYNSYNAEWLNGKCQGVDPTQEMLRSYAQCFNELVNNGLVYAKLQFSEAHYFAYDPSDLAKRRLANG